MKKILSLIIVLTVVISAFVGCGNTAPAEKDYTLSVGVVVSENLAGAKLVETVASVVTDADGKIVLCRVDSLTYAVKYNEDGTLNTTAPTSNAALGDNYGSMPAGTWADQGAALEKYVVGKTQAEVAAIALEGGKATDSDLVAGCSINISDLLKAIDNAFKSAHKVSFKSTATDFTAGLSVVGAVKDKADDTSKNAQYTATFSTAVLAEGKVVAAIFDTAEADLKGITDNGAASVSFAGTKREQGDSYAMTSGAWYVQADAYAQSAIGKTASDIATLATEGVAGCTMPYSTFDFKAGLEAAVKSAR